MKKVLFLTIMLVASSYTKADSFHRKINNLSYRIHSLRVGLGLAQYRPVNTELRYNTQYGNDLNLMRTKLATTTISRNRWRKLALVQAIGSGIAYFLYAKSPYNTVLPADQTAPALPAPVQKS